MSLAQQHNTTDKQASRQYGGVDKDLKSERAGLSPALATGKEWRSRAKGVVSQKTLMERKGDHHLISIFVQLISISDAPRTHKVSRLLLEIECPNLYKQCTIFVFLPSNSCHHHRCSHHPPP